MVEVRLAPPFEFAAHSYPPEWLRVIVDERSGAPVAVPLGRPRPWLHRYPVMAGDPMSEALCLWYVDDPARLRWTWADGLEGFVTLAHKHLLAEEHHRRGNPWPWEDAPHGQRDDGVPHPIRGRRVA